jgi:GNAT superfamily N-acetyltransferase
MSISAAGSSGRKSTISSVVEIRPVTLDDLEVLIEIYLDTAAHHAAIDPEGYRVPARDDVAARLRRRVEEGAGEAAAYVGAIVNGTMVGSASIHIADPPHPGNMARSIPSAEFGVSVVEGWRGKGVGRALIGHLEAWAAERGVERILLNVSEANPDAIRLYRALGYRESGREMRKTVGRS